MDGRIPAHLEVAGLIRAVEAAGGFGTVIAKGERDAGTLLVICCESGASAAHGTIYFKMLDDAAFYAANSMVTDRFLLTTAFNLHFTKPVRAGEVIAEGRWISGRRRVFIAESHLVDAEGDEIGRGTGTFMRSHIALSGLAGYRLSD